MRINFNSLNLGLSGGNRVIFELSNVLVDHGHSVTITHAGLPEYHNWFTPVKAEIIDCGYSLFERTLIKFAFKKASLEDRCQRLLDNMPVCDVNVATYCLTAKPTAESKYGKKFYLVQHYEPLFFPVTSKEKAIAEQSYMLPLRRLCVSQWLVEKVGGTYVGDGVNLQKFKRSLEPKIPDSIMLMIRPNIHWKNPRLTTDVWRLLESRGYKVFVAAGKLTEKKIVEMYQKSQVFIYLSEKEGFGLPPLEAMACGCCVIATSCSPYLKDMVNCYIIPQLSVEGVRVSVDRVLSSWYLQRTLVSNGQTTAKLYDFNKVVDRFEEAIKT